MRAARLCPVCGFINTKDAERCLKCGASLREQDVSDLLSRQGRRAPRVARWLNWADRWLGNWRRRMDRAASRNEAAPEAIPRYYRSPWTAGWLSLLPGGGCLFNRQPKRALWVGGVYGVLFAANGYALHQEYSNWLLVLWVIWVMVSFTEAVSTAARHNGQLWTFRNSLALFSLCVFVLGVSGCLGPFLLSPAVRLVKIRDEVLEPTLARGDQVVVCPATYWFRPPRRGDIVFYDPPMYQMEQPGEIESTTYVINEDNSFERVNALEGDVLERTNGGPILLNGVPMPKEYYPLVPEGLPAAFRIEVPHGRICVLISHYSKESFLATGSFGGISPPPGTLGYVLIGWNEACLITTKEIFGYTVAVYNPPAHRRWLTRGYTTSLPVGGEK